MCLASSRLFLSLGTAILILGFSLTTGCGAPPTVPATYAPPAASKSPIPLRVGLVLDKKLRHYAFDYAGKHFDCGPALVQAAESMSRQAFREVVVSHVDTASQPENLPVAKGLDALVIPQIREIQAFTSKVDAFQTSVQVNVVIKWVVVQDRKIVYANTFTGEYLRAAYDNPFPLALKDHFDKAYQGIAGSTWWKSQEAASPQ